MNHQKFKLIEGKFWPNESREILNNVFFSKIQFHQMKNFSSQERFGTEDKNGLKRIYQLKKSIDKILKMIESAEKKGEQIEIKSEIMINFVKPVKNV